MSGMGRKRPLPRSSTRVLIAHDQRLVLNALQAQLAHAAAVEVVASTHEADAVLALLAELRLDVVLIRYEMAQKEQPPIVTLVRAGYPSLELVLLTDALTPEQSSVVRLTLQPKAIIDHSADADEIVEAVCAPPSADAPVISRADDHPARKLGLTPREESVLLALARGRSYYEIADELAISYATVKYHLHNAYPKLGVRTRLEAMRALVERSLFPYDWL
jgi:DNA-binding NarL/FixJ family response regulator